MYGHSARVVVIDRRYNARYAGQWTVAMGIVLWDVALAVPGAYRLHLLYTGRGTVCSTVWLLARSGGDLLGPPAQHLVMPWSGHLSSWARFLLGFPC